MEETSKPNIEEPPIPPSISGPSPTASLIQARFAAASRTGFVPIEPIPWKPTMFFFYGTLMDPEILQSVLGLSELPKLQRGTILNFKIKIWGIYPALVRAEGEGVAGMAWEVQTEEQFRRLRRYETSAYTWCYCNIDLADGGRVDYARTFRWDGDSESRELKDGAFDLVRWQTFFKPSIFGKPVARC